MKNPQSGSISDSRLKALQRPQLQKVLAQHALNAAHSQIVIKNQNEIQTVSLQQYLQDPDFKPLKGATSAVLTLDSGQKNLVIDLMDAQDVLSAIENAQRNPDLEQGAAPIFESILPSQA